VDTVKKKQASNNAALKVFSNKQETYNILVVVQPTKIAFNVKNDRILSENV